MNHSTSKRTAKAMPQVESTMLIEGITAKIVKCKARQAFRLSNASIRENETFFLVKSERRVNRYYVVHFNETSNTYQCSCGCNMCEHEHLKTVRNFVMNTVVLPVKPEAPEMSTPPTMKEVRSKKASKLDESSTNFAEIAKEMPLTAEEWREVARADRKRQAAWQHEYRQAALALREQAAKEAIA